ncbi:hypothetical protein Q8A67_011084 [Cirrhinus molitorella]|uniref:Uncharacterized protein n=1 Tax=Cirrhinus molitorella TaxID=172907 RepID=A0AA88PX07_9TELE|nr:hypothetical protein Q8A67_011084 [Cirrhinus molitorella]
MCFEDELVLQQCEISQPGNHIRSTKFADLHVAHVLIELLCICLDHRSVQQHPSKTTLKSKVGHRTAQRFGDALSTIEKFERKHYRHPLERRKRTMHLAESGGMFYLSLFFSFWLLCRFAALH